MTTQHAAIPHILMDCDPGLDDAVALLMLARLHHEGAIVLDAVTAVAGNCPADVTASNARFVLDQAGLTLVPVYCGTLSDPPSGIDGRAFHGPDCLGGMGPTRWAPAVSAEEAADRIVRWAASDGPRPRWLLATGPLTNLALALERGPNLAAGVDRVVVMGGAVGNPSGNIRPWAEFNFFSDAQSAAAVCSSRLPVELVPLNVTERLLIGPRDVAALGKTLGGRLLTASIEHSRRALGFDGCYVHDPMAAAALANPGLLEWATVELSVDGDGPTPGRLTERRVQTGMSRAVAVRPSDSWAFMRHLLR